MEDDIAVVKLVGAEVEDVAGRSRVVVAVVPVGVGVRRGSSRRYVPSPDRLGFLGVSDVTVTGEN